MLQYKAYLFLLPPGDWLLDYQSDPTTTPNRAEDGVRVPLRVVLRTPPTLARD